MENADSVFILFLLANDVVFFFSPWYVSNYVTFDCIMLEYSAFMHLFACFLVLLCMYAMFAHMCVSMHVCECMWKPEEGIGFPVPSFSALLP